MNLEQLPHISICMEDVALVYIQSVSFYIHFEWFVSWNAILNIRIAQPFTGYMFD